MSSAPRKTLAKLFIVLALLPWLAEALPAYAQVDPGQSVSGILNLFLGTQAAQPPAVPASDAAQESKDVGITIFGHQTGISLDAIALAILRGVVNKLTNETVAWINSGFKGQGPQYAVNLQSFLQQEADKAAGLVIQNEVPGLCSPFQNVVKVALTTAQSQQGQDIQTSCTLSQVSNNINNFINGDFVGSGGYPAWFEMTQDPYGNPYSSLLNVQATLDNKIATDQANAQTQLSWNKGFLSTENCTEYVDPNEDDLSSISNADDTGSVTTHTLAAGEDLPAGATCTNEVVQTPGDVIQSQLEKVLGSGVDELNVASNFNQITTALVGQLENLVFQQAGKSGLFNSSNANYSGATGTSGNASTQGACFADKSTALEGDTVTWSFAGGTSANTTYLWSGDDVRGDNALSTTSPSASIAYTTEGAKGATLTMTFTDSTGKQTTTRTSCTNTVTVSKYPPLHLSCSIADLTGGIVPGHIAPGTVVVWTVQVTGGSGLLNAININEGASLNITDQNTDKNFDPSKSIGQWNRIFGEGSAVPFTPPALNSPAFWTAFSGGNLGSNPQFIFAGNPAGTPLPLLPDPSTNAITLTIPILYTQNGTWPLQFDEIVDHDPNVPIYTGASCGQSVVVNAN